MRRQLVAVAAATTSLVALAFLIPLAVLLGGVAHDRAEAAAERDAQAVAPVLAITEDAREIQLAISKTVTGGEGRLTVVLADGHTVGAPLETIGDSIEFARTNQAFSAEIDGGLEVLVPVIVEKDREESIIVLRAFVPGSRLNKGVYRAWLVLTVLGVALVLVAVGVGDRLARSVVRPVLGLADAARRLGRGDLTARIAPSGPPEIAEVGRAFNRLAVRIADLLAQERELVADLSHRLRTPLTALALDAEGIDDEDVARRLTDDVAELERVVDSIIAEARRPVREGVGVTSDLSAVTRNRVDFWSALAEDQGRMWAVEISPGLHVVDVHPNDLEALVDALLGNVFAHTDEAVGFRVTVAGRRNRSSVLVVEDNGPGFRQPDDADEGLESLTVRGVSFAGSSGLGLDIVRRTAEAAGGSVLLSNRPSGGARVEVEFPPPES